MNSAELRLVEIAIDDLGLASGLRRNLSKAVFLFGDKSSFVDVDEAVSQILGIPNVRPKRNAYGGLEVCSQMLAVDDVCEFNNSLANSYVVALIDSMAFERHGRFMIRATLIAEDVAFIVDCYPDRIGRDEEDNYRPFEVKAPIWVWAYMLYRMKADIDVFKYLPEKIDQSLNVKDATLFLNAMSSALAEDQSPDRTNESDKVDESAGAVQIAPEALIGKTGCTYETLTAAVDSSSDRYCPELAAAVQLLAAKERFRKSGIVRFGGKDKDGQYKQSKELEDGKIFLRNSELENSELGECAQSIRKQWGLAPLGRERLSVFLNLVKCGSSVGKNGGGYY